MEKSPHFESRAIHEGFRTHDWEGSTLPPIFQTAAHSHHPYSSQYVSFPRDLRDRLADPCLLRYSVGIEHIDDICGNLAATLEKV